MCLVPWISLEPPEEILPDSSRLFLPGSSRRRPSRFRTFSTGPQHARPCSVVRTGAAAGRGTCREGGRMWREGGLRVEAAVQSRRSGGGGRGAWIDVGGARAPACFNAVSSIGCRRWGQWRRAYVGGRGGRRKRVSSNGKRRSRDLGGERGGGGRKWTSVLEGFVTAAAAARVAECTRGAQLGEGSAGRGDL